MMTAARTCLLLFAITILPASNTKQILKRDTRSTNIPQVEIAFSFDTTGSMSSVIQKVRRNVADLIGRLHSDIPGIRIAVFAHGDYMDHYVTKHVDFSTNSGELQYFVRNVQSTGGGDAPEAYEMVLREAWTNLTWTPGSRRSLVMIGDEKPHEPSYPQNKLRVDWRQEVSALANMGIKIYAVRALDASDAEFFYKTMSEQTGGYYLRFKTFDYIFNFIMAITYREYGLPLLQAYEAEVNSRYRAENKQTPEELKNLFSSLKSQAGSTTPPTGVIDPSKYLPPLEPRMPSPQPTDMDIYFLHIRSEVAFRFATTHVTSKLANKKKEAQEAIFHIELPEAAFIMNFTIERDGQVYVAEVKEKELAKKIYEKAKNESKSAGHVSVQPKHTNNFKISVNVEAESKVTFNLMYQELLERRAGLYEHIIHVDPGQVVKDFKIDVFIQESTELTHLNVPPMRLGIARTNSLDKNDVAVIQQPSLTSANVSFAPTPEQQQQMSKIGTYGQFVVQYDVKRSNNGGELQLSDGYFVHYLAPQTGLQALPRNIVFVLDTSGSMSFRKMIQLKTAMAAILDQLKPGDFFTLMTYSSFFIYWKEEMAPVNADNINNAKDFVSKMFAAGGTNIDKALTKGIGFLNAHAASSQTANPSMVVFLTDGQPTDGERNKTKILENVRNAASNKISIYSLGFGSQVDMTFLKKMSYENQGFTRRIYEEGDADLQLKGFYDEISVVLLTNVRISYQANVVNTNTITLVTYDKYYQGSEIVIAGEIVDNKIQTITSKIDANSKTGAVEYTVDVAVRDGSTMLPSLKEISGFTERLWAYLTIKQMLRKALITPDEIEQTRLNNRSLELSLKYNFVTPLTSMVVVLPDKAEQGEEENNDVTDSESDGIDDRFGLPMDERYPLSKSGILGGEEAVDHIEVVDFSGSAALQTSYLLMMTACLLAAFHLGMKD